MTNQFPIFIFSSGQRCGSTLLQRLLNSNPEILIWGEQHGYLNGFYREYRGLLEWEYDYSHHREKFFAAGYDNFVANMVPGPLDLRKAATAHIYSLFGQTAEKHNRSIWGFKEVRYDSQIALFLLRCFPNARFIHLTRNIVDCFISLKHWENSSGPWNRAWTEIFIQDWQRINASFLNVIDRIPNLLKVRFEDMTSNPSLFINKLSVFLDIPSDAFELSVFKKKLHRENAEGNIDTRPLIRTCDLNLEERKLLSTESISELSQHYGYKIEL